MRKLSFHCQYPKYAELFEKPESFAKAGAVGSISEYVVGMAVGGSLGATTWGGVSLLRRLRRPAPESGNLKGFDPNRMWCLQHDLQCLSADLTRDVGVHSELLGVASQELETAVQNGDVRPGSAAIPCIAGLIRANVELTRKLDDAHQLLREKSQEIQTQLSAAFSDPLTSVANRPAFDYELSRRIQEWQRQKTPVSLVILDVDHFKRLNDTYGHPAGDEVLKLLARTLESTVRQMDLVARYGGEEFCVVLPNSGESRAKEAAERLRQTIADRPFKVDGTELSITVSVGVSCILANDDAASLLKRSDLALYESKRAGRNCVHFHTGTNCELVGERPPTPPAEEVEIQETSLVGATADGLTGLPNQRYFEEELRRRVAEARRYGATFSLLAVQIDNFQRVRGLDVKSGPLVLKATAQLFRSAVRESDLVAKYADDMFVAMLTSSALSESLHPARRLRNAVASCERVGRAALPGFTVSVGAAEAMPGDVAESLLSRTFAACRAASGAGGDRIYIHDPAEGLRPDTEAAGFENAATAAVNN